MENALNTCTLKVSQDQLHLISKALDFYSRVGIGQWEVLIEHPTFDRLTYDAFRPKRTPEIGDRTPQGDVLDIKDGKALISGSVKDGRFSPEHEWKHLEDVELSADWSLVHGIRAEVKKQLAVARNTLINDFSTGANGSFGINSPKVDESCREAFSLHKVIRHEFWKKNPDRMAYTVDAYAENSNAKIEIL